MTFINEPLLERGVNWLVVGTIATFWLLAFHVVMRGWSRMTANAGTG